jgi:uncharacterized membrane protein
MTLESSKTLGGVGAILVVVGFLGFFGYAYAGILVLIGAILTLIALKGMSDHYKEAGIFNNALYGFITAIIGVVAFIAAMVVVIIMAISGLDWTDPAAIQQYFMDLSNVWNIIGTVIIAFVVLFVFFIIAAIFARKSLSMLSAKSGEKIFETAGLVWLIGAILTIVLVGLILIWIAWILIIVGFFSIKTTATQPPPQPPPPPP